MLGTRDVTTRDAIAVTRVGPTAWILRPLTALAGPAVDALRDAFLEAVDFGARNVVVDFSRTATITSDGAATLVAMADQMLGRNGVLWIAARLSDGDRHVLRAIEEHGPESLAGLTAELDAALEQYSFERNGRLEDRGEPESFE